MEVKFQFRSKKCVGIWRLFFNSSQILFCVEGKTSINHYFRWNMSSTHKSRTLYNENGNLKTTIQERLEVVLVWNEEKSGHYSYRQVLI